MTIQLKNLAGTSALSTETARKWLRGGGYAVPDYIDDNCLDLFLDTRDKTYGFLQQQWFLSDIDGFYQARKSLRMARKNLEGYAQQVRRLSVTDSLVLEVLGVKKGGKTTPELLGAGRTAIEDLLAEERAYIRECWRSLEEQWNWHLEGRVDKGLLSDGDISGILAAFSEETRLHNEKVEQVREARKKIQDDTKEAKKKKPKGTQDKDAEAYVPPPMPDPYVPPAEKDRVKYAYYEPVRNRLMSLGFVVSPPGTALGAVFPPKDWRRKVPEVMFNQKVKAYTDELVSRYHLVGDDETSLTRLLLPRKSAFQDLKSLFAGAVGCLCVSWTRHQVNGETVHVPILGLSGVVREEPGAAYLQLFCRHLALPNWQPDTPIPPAPDQPFQSSEKLKGLQKQSGMTYTQVKDLLTKKDLDPESEDGKALAAYRELQAKTKKRDEKERKAYQEGKIQNEIQRELTVNYETMLERTSLAAFGYRARTRMRLRTPARQALFSYVSFRKDKVSKNIQLNVASDPGLGVDLWLSGWHSLNCAEPAALMTASSYFAEGCDVIICFPYEGFNDTGPGRNRPKETCPWCAAVELGFRSLSENKNQVNQSVSTGNWLTQLTSPLQDEPQKALPVNQGFDAFDDENPIMHATRNTLAGTGPGLVKNSDLETPAYAPSVMTKIGRLRSMYYMLGLADREVVALDRPLYPYAGFGEVTKFLR
ncbi:hypothetical protein [Corallococcus sp. AS-1-6]|uniref:hypothetical protein n=1 Tax=Corallococcus sp. AS-1-6 TaxID=2874599 RepID=UPI001CC1C193|nr:hypothetical protein [Corallococcus sp. AS-1-6]MBZ4371630.1 hypothetical protein [Corallococcus sp. AS-1-6]